MKIFNLLFPIYLLAIVIASSSEDYDYSLRNRYELCDSIDKTLGLDHALGQEIKEHHTMPIEWLTQLKDLSRNFLQPLLQSTTGPLKTVYNQKMPVHIKQWLCPADFFSLDGRIEVKVRKEIFCLLSLKEIDDAIIAPLKKLPTAVNQLQELVKNSKDLLYNIILTKYWEKLVTILAGVSGPEKLPKALRNQSYSDYNSFSNTGILQIILYKRLKDAGKMGNFCPTGFFTLNEDVRVEENIQKEIFGLLELDDIFDELISKGYYRQTQKGIKEFFEEYDEWNIRALRHQIINDHWDGLANILVEIPELATLPEVMKNRRYHDYNAFCSEGISQVILYGRLKNAKEDENIGDFCPQNFFTLNNDVKVGEEMQRKIFELLKVDELFNYLVSKNYHKKNQKSIKEFLSNERYLEGVCDKIINDHWEELIEILIGIPQLEEFSEALENRFYDCYDELSDEGIPRVILYGELKKAKKEGNIGDFCPRDFFTLDAIVEIEENMQSKCFELLTIKEIVDVLMMWGFHKQKNRGIKDFIDDNLCIISALRNKIIENHWDKLIETLSEIQELATLPRDLKNKRYQDYYDFSAEVPKEILYGMVKEATNNGKDIFNVCPDGFFDLEDAGVEIDEEKQRKIFGLLTLDEIFNVLLLHYYHKRREEIRNFIASDSFCMKDLRDLIVQNHREDLENILVTISGLEKLSDIMITANYKSYKQLLKDGIPKAIQGEKLKEAENN